MDLKKMLADERVKPYLMKARYGIEKEGQRVDLDGHLATTCHPANIGMGDEHPYIQRDFSETQMELITPVLNTLDELFDYLSGIHDVAYRSMGKNEMLWPLSMPPALPKKEEDIMIAKLNNFENVLYRRSLANSYGRRKQMICGIHFNFEFRDELLRMLFDLQSDFDDYQQFKTDIYLKLTRNYLYYRWLVTYFYGASPRSEENFYGCDDQPDEPVRSIRSSRFGYTNHDDVNVSFSTIQKYISDLSSVVNRGLLVEEKEFYTAMRLRGSDRVADFEHTGVRYVELRNIDLNPFETNGISYEQAEFLHVFLLYLLQKEEDPESDEWGNAGDARNDVVALEHPLAHTQFEAEAHELVDEMEQLSKDLDFPVSESLFVNLREMLADPSKTLAGRLYSESEKTSQSQVATEIARETYTQLWEKPYELTGFTDMELSTQIMMYDAIQKGIKVEVLDRQDQFLKLKLHDHIEYVKNGNMTSKDTYVSTLIMENKTVTKKILHQEGYRVPGGDEFSNSEEALRAYEMFAKTPFVVKPKTTNYGIGISIFKDGASYEDYEKAISLAFDEDSSVLVEEFLEGTEYRFFVLHDKVLAVMLRVPANVTGDGTHTIKELVEEKNRDPLRGTDHRTPLELIQLGELEVLMLKGQGYQLNSIPEDGEIVYLRENSNVSTGGDSIDVTDQVSEDYKKIAVDAVAALGAKISGIDLIIEDLDVPAANPGAYGIIEANFNPSMYMHIYPYKGKTRRVTTDILHYLFPELL
ncbi:bifunctional glutamate--cysteine ligase/glutathione synthetase [Sporosarcina sp. P16a]|uniref:bifunctional glutamate--cysteine ligase GshA/glutathione synthetase GshB n=1 Tax=unclassified Sporosarcina TaxID=2647733 RepID=UPI000C1636ED|nr:MULTISPECIES: bifunctional glutamate--cysteine ligase GshA/glutathione synthetase GshB [unclassified Sporosarcina]PIC66399.1 bifunctional glutamate--cysteine ligase/glutathione synthetase [Sporosarcina sp. P16a]PIC93878.1 bifunctional glutamate--cysteine ligase/glutathione synthetase [Sporosarcina sp. P25]